MRGNELEEHDKDETRCAVCIGYQPMYIVYQSTSIIDTLVHVCQEELSRV